MFIRDLLGDNRFWFVALLCAGLLVTLERVQSYAYGAWPQMRRGQSSRPLAMGYAPAWYWVMCLLLPGVVMLLSIVGLLLWREFPRPNVLNLATVLLALPWIVFVVGSLERIGASRYLRRLGIALPLALCASLLLADYLLLSALVNLVQAADLGRVLRDARG